MSDRARVSSGSAPGRAGAGGEGPGEGSGAPGLPTPVVSRLAQLAAEVGRTPADLAAPVLSDDEFDHLARLTFTHQFGGNAVYRAFCEGRGVSPERWEGWRGVPSVPTRAFREFDFVSGDPGGVERIFWTSGTTGGESARGRHPVLSLDLYRTLSLPWLRRHLLPEGGRARILSLIPAPTDRPDSSLATMVGFLIEDHATDTSSILVNAGHELRLERALHDLGSAQLEEEFPVLLIGTAFSFVHLTDQLTDRGARFKLPAGSRIMETGGFKGRSREVSRDELYREMSESLGVPGQRIVNEYGMTELLSQFYEPVLAGGDRHLVGPPWVRTAVLDPESLAPVSSGQRGILAHFDLANVGSVSAILTQDLGVAMDEGFLLHGRVPGAEPRGCSLAVEELLEVGR